MQWTSGMSLGYAAICLLTGMSAALPTAATGAASLQASEPLGLHQQVFAMLAEHAPTKGSFNASLVPMIRDALTDLEQEDPSTAVDDADIKLLLGSLEAAKAKGQATPGMTKFVEKVTEMIDKDLAVKINAAHKSAQGLVKVMLKNFEACKASKKSSDGKIKLLVSSYKKSSKSHKTCRNSENNWWRLKTGCQKVLRTKLRLYRSECNALKLLKRDPNKEADNCHTTNKPEPYGNWLARNYRWFAAKDRVYDKQKKKCDRARAAYFRYKPGCDKKVREWGKKRSGCNLNQKSLEGTTCSAAKLMLTTCRQKYTTCYEDAEDVYNEQLPILKKNEKDRKTEWRALMRIKCLLGVFATEDGVEGAVAGDTIDVCKVKTHSTSHLSINYGKIPPMERCPASPNVPCSSPFYNQEYRRLPSNAKAAKCSLCRMPAGKFATKPIFWLKARNYKPAQDTWRNVAGKGASIRNLHRGHSRYRPVVRSLKGGGARRPVTALYGSRYTQLWFGNIFPSRYTICSLTRYTGGRRGRILNGGHVNWLHGHWANRAGVAYYRGWRTNTHNKINRHQWLAFCGRNGGRRSRASMLMNGRPVGIRHGGVRPTYLSVNFGHYGNERSDFAIAEIVIFQETLGDAAMQRVEQYLLNTLKRKRRLKPNPRYTTRAMPCTGPQLSVLDPGTSSRTSFRCNDGRCISIEGRCNRVKNCRDGSDERGCGRKKLKPNPKYRTPARACTTRQRLRLKKGRGDRSAFRCRDGQCIKAMGRCNGFRNCNDGSDEKYCPKKRKPKSRKQWRKIGQTMVIKYTNRWPHCTNLRCFGNVPINWAKNKCLRDRRCDGFSFTRAAFRKGRGHGCLKRNCKNDAVKGYGKGAYGYIEKRKRVAGPKCKDLVARYTYLWRTKAVGLDFSAYMSGKNSLRWMGMWSGSGPKNFFCRDRKWGIEWGSRYSGRTYKAVVRALLGGAGVPPTYSGCCKKSRPNDVCNAPNDRRTIHTLCRKMGYNTGYITAWAYNGCPAVKSVKGRFTSTFRPPPNHRRIGARFACKGRIQSTRWVIRIVRFRRSLSWMSSYRFARRRGGRLLTLRQAQHLLKRNRGAFFKKKDYWAAVYGKGNKRDWVQVGDRVHKPGISHVQRFGYPKWGNTGKGKEAKVLMYRARRRGNRRYYRR